MVNFLSSSDKMFYSPGILGDVSFVSCAGPGSVHRRGDACI